MRAMAMGGEASVDEALNAVRAQPEMAGRALAAEGLDARPVRLLGRGLVTDRGRRLRLQALDPATGSPWSGAAVTVYPHDVDADELVDYDGVLLSNGPGDPEPLDRRAGDRSASLIGRVPILGSASATSCSRSRPVARRTSSRSATAARNHPVLERATNGVLVTSQNHGFAVAPTQSREETHISLYDGTVEGLRAAQRAGALGAVPPGGRPRAARRAGDPRVVGRGGERPCQGGVTSSRSA